MIKGVLLDLSGVIYEGEGAIPGALSAVARIRRSGLPVRFLTNTTRMKKRDIFLRLTGFGLSLTQEELFTPSQAACDWLRRHDCSAHLLVHPNLEPEFGKIPSTERKAVIVGDAGNAFDYASLNDAFRELIGGAAFLALAANRTFKDADGALSLDAGAFVKALEYASGKSAVVLGKPSADFFAAALKSIPCEKEHAVMVGDDAESDIAGALSSGIAAALLVRTGKYRDGDEKRFTPNPTTTVADLAAAADWIIANQNTP